MVAVAAWVNNGCMGDIRLVEVTERPLDLAAMEDLVADRRAGGVVSFSGNVRDHDHDRAVVWLTYEAHPTAPGVLVEVAQEINDRFSLIGLAVAHRVGKLAIGDRALVAVVSSAHRREAFLACQALVDLTKVRLPIWKHQVFADGTDEWVNCA